MPKVHNLNDLKARLQSLFAESAVHFTDLALEMKFTAKNMVADIQTFQTYMLNLSFASNLDHNEFLYAKLRAKMTSVSPNILIQIMSERQLNLDNTATFAVYVQQANLVAHRMQNSAKRELS